jgi:hypothetical protein
LAEKASVTSECLAANFKENAAMTKARQELAIAADDRYGGPAKRICPACYFWESLYRIGICGKYSLWNLLRGPDKTLYWRLVLEYF